MPTGDSGPRMLVIDALVPDPARDSGSLRLQSMMQLLLESGWRIDFFADDGASASDAQRLAESGIGCVHGNIVRWLRSHGPALHTVVLSRAPIASQYLALVRKFAPQARVVFDTVDLHFLRERRGAELAHDAALLRQADQTLHRELTLIHQSDLCLVVSDEERRMLAELTPGHQVHVLSNIHRVYGREAPFEARRDLLFVGGFSHPPNLDAMQWFVREILPLVRASIPGIQLHVIGDLTPQASSSLRGEGVQLLGRIADLAPLMSACRLSVAPLRFGAGVKGKVNMAMSHGLPTVVTPIAAEGMHLVDGENALIAESPQAFADAIVRGYHNADLWQRLSDGGLRNIQTHFSIELARQQVNRLFAS